MEGGEGVVDTTSNRLQRVRPVRARVLGAASEGGLRIGSAGQGVAVNATCEGANTQKTFRGSGLVHIDFHAPVQGTPIRRIVISDRAYRAHADGLQAVNRHAAIRQFLHDGLRTLLRQL